MSPQQFNVLTWDFNSDRLKYYDVLPYFRDLFKQKQKTFKLKRVAKIIERNPDAKKYYWVPTNREELKEFIEKEAMYRYWSRCEWEMIIHGWPKREQSYKLDVYEQIMMNIDIVTDILYTELLKPEE